MPHWTTGKSYFVDDPPPALSIDPTKIEPPSTAELKPTWPPAEATLVRIADALERIADAFERPIDDDGT